MKLFQGICPKNCDYMGGKKSDLFYDSNVFQASQWLVSLILVEKNHKILV